MRLLQPFLLTSLAVLTVAPVSASRVHRGPTSSKQSKHKAAKGKKTVAAARPRAMDDTRATEIQSALVKAGYLQEVTGHWDSSSQAAMQKLQGDNGWQTKLIPDSRALIKLGLGPTATLRNDSIGSFSGTGNAEDTTGN